MAHLLTQQFEHRKLRCGKDELRVSVINIDGQVLVSQVSCQVSVLILNQTDGWVNIEAN